MPTVTELEQFIQEKINAADLRVHVDDKTYVDVSVISGIATAAALLVASDQAKVKQPTVDWIDAEIATARRQHSHRSDQPSFIPSATSARIARGAALKVLREDAMLTYQMRVHEWMLACFGPAITKDGTERNYRFLEEALELVQSTGCTQAEAHQLVDYVFGRPVGEPSQEVGGVMVTLAALCNAHSLDMMSDGQTELTRINNPETIDKIRRKQAAKPQRSPLPGVV